MANDTNDPFAIVSCASKTYREAIDAITKSKKNMSGGAAAYFLEDTGRMLREVVTRLGVAGRLLRCIVVQSTNHYLIF